MAKAKSKTKVATRSAAQKMRKGKFRARSVPASSKPVARPDTKHARIISMLRAPAGTTRLLPSWRRRIGNSTRCAAFLLGSSARSSASI
jgi:hypothetical protein